ncbi:MAG TPA: site-2 protease family protein [Chitinophagaceae bacterium]|jgi:Zn-dependent protease
MLNDGTAEDNVSNHEAREPAPAAVNLYPPKPQLEETRSNIWLRSVISLGLYLVIGYYFFSANWALLLVLTGIVIFHELGHFTAMKLFRYDELGIFFIPLLGAYASGTKRQISQRQSAIILLAGPMPGIIAGIILLLVLRHQPVSFTYHQLAFLQSTGALLIFLNVLNLLPIYPLDGGQLLNRLFLDDSKIVAKTFVILSAAAMAFFAIRIEFYPLLVFPAMMVYRLVAEARSDRLTAKVEAVGVNLEKTYDEITDEDYWKIRDVLIASNHSSVRNVRPGVPYEYAVNEDKVVSAVENLLQRSIIQDLSGAGKVLIVLVWLAGFSVPFLMDLDLPFFSGQGR